MRCPTCASEVNGGVVCPRCGTLTGLESTLRLGKQRLRNFFAEKRSLLPARFERHHFLWACALAPIFIVPPLFSLVTSIVLMRRGDASKQSNLDWIAVISAINIILSGIVLYRAGVYLHEFWAWASSLLDMNLKPWLRFYFPESGPKSTPV